MPDMYDKLGDMLNDVLESGKIPQNNNNDQVISDEKIGESGHFSFNEGQKNTVNNKKSVKKDSKKPFATGEVIKLHKYTYNMQFPPHIQKALTTLDIVYSFTQKDIKKQYHKLLKENHPDRQNTIQSSKSVQNIRHYTVNEITDSYKILCDFFGIK